MPLTPEDTQTDSDAMNPKTTEGNESDSMFGKMSQSKYLKPVAAALVAVGAGFLVRRWRTRGKGAGETKSEG